ncbi:hypothetical protein MKEN_00964400 [Mycena kentingensis (nom. inval.)]|nr:hypothetical protein MKEN_00964400 [Mycena kentingensis (nom. inval.)]
MYFSVLALAATYLSAGVHALAVNAPSGLKSAGTATVTWSSTDSDPVFSIELHHDSFNQDFAIANNVDPATKSITIDLPQVPAGDGYTLNFVNITDITKVYASSSGFSIAAAASGSATRSTASVTGSAGATGSAASGSAASSASISASVSGSASGSASSPSTTPSSASSLRTTGVTAILLALLGAAFTL